LLTLDRAASVLGKKVNIHLVSVPWSKQGKQKPSKK
jgi:hypothetical protein